MKNFWKLTFLVGSVFALCLGVWGIGHQTYASSSNTLSHLKSTYANNNNKLSANTWDALVQKVEDLSAKIDQLETQLKNKPRSSETSKNQEDLKILNTTVKSLQSNLTALSGNLTALSNTVTSKTNSLQSQINAKPNRFNNDSCFERKANTITRYKDYDENGYPCPARVTIPERATEIRSMAFWMKWITSVNNMRKIKKIWNSAFAYNSISSLDQRFIHNNLLRIEEHAFRDNILHSNHRYEWSPQTIIEKGAFENACNTPNWKCKVSRSNGDKSNIINNDPDNLEIQ